MAARRDDLAQTAREMGRLGVSTIVEGVATGIVTVGTATPIVAPLCIALLKAKNIVDEVSRNKEDLEEMCEWCNLITEQVIIKATSLSTPTIDVSPLQECVDDLNKVAKRYHRRDRGRWARFVYSRKDGEDIERLRVRIQTIVPIMGLAGFVDMSAAKQPRLAPVPQGVPIGQSWHAMRDGVVGRVCQILGGDGGPRVVALTGRSGAGKTTAAAAMVGEQGPIRLHKGETEDEARTRLSRVRALFPHGVVWLRVGKGEGAADRLPSLMFSLAQALYKNVMGKGVNPPAVGENGESYVKKVVSQESLRCLVVADDVWEAQVMEKLRETGMWVLLTTRVAEVVEPNERVVVDQLTEVEAEDVLRGAARLRREPLGERLCDDAMEVLDICGYVAMDIAFVGSWSSVRAADSGVAKSKEAWADAVENIKNQIAAVRAQISVANAGMMDDRDVNRLAVLRAGFKYLGAEDAVAQELYVALGVFPDGHAFKESDAAVLLYDEESPTHHHVQVATGTIAILERWAVLSRAHTSGLYRMHDAHVSFARRKLTGWENVCRPVIDRWTSHISRVETMLSVDLYALLDMWCAIERVGGDGWWQSRPYDDQLVHMDAPEGSKIHSVNVVAELYEQEKEFVEMEKLMRKVFEHSHDRDGPGVQMAALYYIYHSLLYQGRFAKAVEEWRRLGDLFDPSFQFLQSAPRGVDDSPDHMSAKINAYAVCAVASGRFTDAEEWFRNALMVQEDCGLVASSQTALILHELGLCVRKAGRPGEAQGLLKRALSVRKAKLGADDQQVAWTLHELGVCEREAGRPGNAEKFIRQALGIKEAKLGAHDQQVAVTLHELGRCVREAGRPGDAEALFRRALGIKETGLGADDPQVAVTLHELGLCVREVERPGDAEALFRRALGIKKAGLGADDLHVAVTLLELGRCVREAGRPEDAEASFRRALEIQEAKLGADDPQVAVTLLELGRCVQEAGRPEDVEALLRRALKIQEARLGTNDPRIAVTLLVLGRCVREAGRLRDAEALLRRALEIHEARLGAGDLHVGLTLLELGRCVREARRLGDAEVLFRRALEIQEARLRVDDPQVFVTLRELGQCVREAGRLDEAEELFTRAVRVRRAETGLDVAPCS